MIELITGIANLFNGMVTDCQNGLYHVRLTNLDDKMHCREMLNLQNSLVAMKDINHGLGIYVGMAGAS